MGYSHPHQQHVFRHLEHQECQSILVRQGISNFACCRVQLQSLLTVYKPRGKFYKDGNKDAEISSSDVNQKTAPPGGSVHVNSCGRSDASSGTTGGFEIYDGETKIGRVHWDCPWGSKQNDFGVDDRDKAHWVEVGPWNSYGGAIGSVNVEVGKKG